ncbi:hypothetical protein RhiirB3_453013 [Rhizophagus irregularis]|nr:hypothetical protein RhiirB3_453013 [Rhizophagus irregularis]
MENDNNISERENFSIPQFELEAFVNITDKEKAHEWFQAFESHSKTTMPQTKGYGVKGKKVLLREKRHCIHGNDVKKKQDSAESLSFRRVKEEVRERFLELFGDGHSPASAIYSYEDSLHTTAESDQELLEMLADRAINPDYGYIVRLFHEYRNNTLGSHNGEKMFERLVEVIDHYNNSSNGRAIMQEYDAQAEKAFILCIVSSLMCRIYEKIPQAGEICYVNASASFEPLNTAITLLYTSCAAGALPLGVLITSDESEIILEKALNLLKMILPLYAFYGRGPQVGPIVFLTDDSSAFWRWLYDSKYRINKDDRTPIIKMMKKILYASTEPEMDNHYQDFKHNFFRLYPQLQKHFDLLWECAIGTCSCHVGMTGAPCKHQGAVSVKFHISNFNFLPSLTPNDRMIYSYIALGYIAKNSSFYASLHAESHNENDEQLTISNCNYQLNSITDNKFPQFLGESNENNKIKENEINTSTLGTFLEEIKVDYENCGPQFRTALDKFAERYHASKSKSIPRLCSFLYDINHNVDPIRIKSGAMIRVQVESVKRRKRNKSGGTRKAGGKENLDPQIIPSQKKKKTGKKEHNLSKNILRNQLN